MSLAWAGLKRTANIQRNVWLGVDSLVFFYFFFLVLINTPLQHKDSCLHPSLHLFFSVTRGDYKLRLKVTCFYYSIIITIILIEKGRSSSWLEDRL